MQSVCGNTAGTIGCNKRRRHRWLILRFCGSLSFFQQLLPHTTSHVDLETPFSSYKLDYWGRFSSWCTPMNGARQEKDAAFLGDFTVDGGLIALAKPVPHYDMNHS